MASGLADLTPRLGFHAHLAGKLFEIEGAWSTDEDEPAVRVHLARHSRYHGWHAELWSDLLPDSVGLAEQARVTAPDAIWAGQLEPVTGVAGTGERLAVLYRCLIPRLLTATDCLLSDLDPVANAAALRAGGFVRADLIAEQVAGTALLHALVSGPALAEALGDAAAIDVALSESGFGRCGA